jgi:hypothetical protein
VSLRIVLAILGLLLLVAVFRAAFRLVVVYEYERGLRYARGKFTGLGPDRVGSWRARGAAKAGALHV